MKRLLICMILGGASANVWPAAAHTASTSSRVEREWYPSGQLLAETTYWRGERNGSHRRWWPDGRLQVDARYVDDVRHGVYRTFHASGAPYELRHFRAGHEDGTQQSWTADGELYLNYDVRAGKRYGLINATPCNEVPGN
jgi:antitoxin component YwqK of YwqJK toxin-antitoxin module